MSKQIVNKEGIIIPEGTVEDFKRPNHPDFMTGSELSEMKFSGLRSNSITNDSEIWLEGEVVSRVTVAQLAQDPMAISKAMEEVFALQGKAEIRPDIPELRAFKKLTGE